MNTTSKNTPKIGTNTGARDNGENRDFAKWQKEDARNKSTALLCYAVFDAMKALTREYSPAKRTELDMCIDAFFAPIEQDKDKHRAGAVFRMPMDASETLFAVRQWLTDHKEQPLLDKVNKFAGEALKIDDRFRVYLRTTFGYARVA